MITPLILAHGGLDTIIMVMIVMNLPGIGAILFGLCKKHVLISAMCYLCSAISVFIGVFLLMTEMGKFRLDLVTLGYCAPLPLGIIGVLVNSRRKR